MHFGEPKAPEGFWNVPEPGRVLGEDIHRMQGDCIAQEEQIHLQFSFEPSYSGRARNRCIRGHIERAGDITLC